MELSSVIRSATFMFVLLNPFLLSIYLISVIRDLPMETFLRVMLRAAMISFVVFASFAWLGDFVFTKVLHARFASFLIFGGIVFLIIGIRMMLNGPEAVKLLHGKPEHIAGAVAMPFMIGPGTINASILAGARNVGFGAFLAIALAITATILVLTILKATHDALSATGTRLVERYVNICGRVSSLIVGTLAVEMILMGIEQWMTQMKQAT